jgi:hypothetical protein
VLIPASIEKKISIELISMVLFRKSTLMISMIIGLIKVSAIIEIIIIEYDAIIIAVCRSIFVQAYSETGNQTTIPPTTGISDAKP